MPESTVIIVGGGAAGLSAAAALARRGIGATVLEQDATLGGTWARRYERLHLHTMREFSGLAHYPIPQRYPQYLSRDDMVAYLNEYARTLDLRIVAGAKVRRVAARSAEARTREGEGGGAPDVLDEQGEPRGTAGEPTAFPGLYFVGFTHSLRGHLFEARRASLRLARHIERYLR